MKKLLFCLFLFPVSSFAQYYYSFNDISGKWVEQTRTDKKSDVIPFKDTLYIEIHEDGFMMVRHTIGATFYGDATLVENMLSIQKEKFSIEGNEDGVLKLKQDKVTHRFVKQIEFKDAPVEKILPGIERGEVLIDFENLKGKWTVYKKTDPQFKSNTFYIKTMAIMQKNMNNVYTGQVTFHNMDSIYTSEAVIKIQDKEMQLLCTDKVLKTTMLKNDGEEMILTFGSVSYFLTRMMK